MRNDAEIPNVSRDEVYLPYLILNHGLQLVLTFLDKPNSLCTKARGPTCADNNPTLSTTLTYNPHAAL